ncbi:AmpG family muropeptide MFS transporter [Hirschia maritima]|uniref:AmpG family muropeptide MFS transporter n=1 Tax=Hirschia maritima TaxID=1121961 RepID=UPI000368479F|nr:MFS transporter [Hirschia maritima]
MIAGINSKLDTLGTYFKNALGPYSSPKIASMLVLGFSSGLPILLLYGTFSTRLREAGISRTTIGFLSLIGLFYAFKFLWAPFIDRWKVPGLSKILGQRRAWILVCQIGLIIGLVSLGISDPASNLVWTSICAVIVAFFSATQDIVIDGWRIDVANDDDQGDMAAATQIGYRFGLIVAGGGALAFADAIDWTLAYWFMALMIAIAGIGLFKVCEPDRSEWISENFSLKPIMTGIVAAFVGLFFSIAILQFVSPELVNVLDSNGNPVLGDDGNNITKESNGYRIFALLYLAGAWVPVFISCLVFLIPKASNFLVEETIEISKEILKAVAFIFVLGLFLLSIVQGVRTYFQWDQLIADYTGRGDLSVLYGWSLQLLSYVVSALGFVLGKISSFFSLILQYGGVYALVILALLPFCFASGLGVFFRTNKVSESLSKGVVLGAFVDYARKYGPGAGLLLLMIATYRMTDTTMGVMAKPFYVEQGFTKTEVGLISGSLGPWILLVGAIFAGISIRYLGLFKSLVIGELLMITTNAAFAWLAMQSDSIFWHLCVTITADNIAAGFAGTVFIAYMSSLTSKGFSATQYALFTSFFALYGKLLASMSGVLADEVGWEAFFLITAAIGIPAMIILFLVRYFKSDEPSLENA